MTNRPRSDARPFRGVNRNVGISDAYIHWNFDINRRYEGNADLLLQNIRGLARHEILHPLGMLSYLAHENGVSDPRGRQQSVTLFDGMLFDAADKPLLGNFNASNREFTINNYQLRPEWTTPQDRSEQYLSGLYFLGNDKQGNPAKMKIEQLSPGIIDFSHVYGVSYADTHPSWSNWEEVDFNFLRGLGYEFIGDTGKLVVSLEALGYFNGVFSIRLTGPAGKAVTVQRSTDLANWINWQSLTLGSAPITIQDAQTGENRSMFYRAMH